MTKDDVGKRVSINYCIWSNRIKDAISNGVPVTGVLTGNDGSLDIVRDITIGGIPLLYTHLSIAGQPYVLQSNYRFLELV